MSETNTKIYPDPRPTKAEREALATLIASAHQEGNLKKGASFDSRHPHTAEEQKLTVTCVSNGYVLAKDVNGEAFAVFQKDLVAEELV